MERHPNNVGGGSAFFSPPVLLFFFFSAYAGVKFIDKSTIFFFFLAISYEGKLILGSFLLQCRLIWFALKGGTGATLGFLPDFQEMLQHLLLYH